MPDEEKSLVETSEGKKDWAESESLPAFPSDETGAEEEAVGDTDSSDSDVMVEVPTGKSDSEDESADKTETRTEEVANLPSKEETELLAKYGLDEFADKGGVEAALKDYAAGRKTFTQTRQNASEIDKLAEEHGITGENAGAKLTGLIKTAIKEANQKEVDPLDAAYTNFLDKHRLTPAEAEEQNWSKEKFASFREGMGFSELQQTNQILTAALSQFVPLLYRNWYQAMASEYEAKSQKVLAPFEELQGILESNPELVKKANSNGKNPMREAYRAWAMENHGDKALSFVYEAGKHKEEEQKKKMVNAKKVEKPGGKLPFATKSVSDLTPEEFAKLPLSEQEKVVRSPQYQRMLRKALSA